MFRCATCSPFPGFVVNHDKIRSPEDSRRVSESKDKGGNVLEDVRPFWSWTKFAFIPEKSANNQNQDRKHATYQISSFKRIESRAAAASISCDADSVAVILAAPELYSILKIQREQCNVEDPQNQSRNDKMQSLHRPAKSANMISCYDIVAATRR